MVVMALCDVILGGDSLLSHLLLGCCLCWLLACSTRCSLLVALSSFRVHVLLLYEGTMTALRDVHLAASKALDVFKKCKSRYSKREKRKEEWRS